MSAADTTKPTAESGAETNAEVGAEAKAEMNAETNTAANAETNVAMSTETNAKANAEKGAARERLGLNQMSRRVRQRKRVGRGCSAGGGKTCGRGQKGQKSRTGSGIRGGFEGGQMPLQRRLPKFGFRSRKAKVCEVRLDALNKLEQDIADRDALVKLGVVPARAERVKLICSGQLERAVTVKGIGVSAGARRAVEAAGGRVE